MVTSIEDLEEANTPSVNSQDMSPLEALRSKPKASFNKSFRKANEMLRVSLEELEADEGTTVDITKDLT